MNSILSTLLILFYIRAAQAQPVQMVVPNNLANVEGNSSASEPFNSTSFRFQQVFDASQFSIPPGTTVRVDQISFRIDGASANDVLLFFGGSSAQLSTTQREPDGLSSVFADNRGADAVTIWNGALGIGTFLHPGMTPQPFDPTIPVTTPFFYSPSMGNLLLEVAGAGGQAILPGSLDAQTATGDAISWVWSGNGNSASGTASTLGLVTRFDVTVVPEPSISWLAAVGVILMAICRQKQSHGSH